MLKHERQVRILAQLKKHGVVRVADLAERCGASPVTIRRDLMTLEAAGQLHRVHGGAVSREVQPVETDTTQLSARVAAAAARFIPHNSVVFLDPGVLTAEVVAFLQQHEHLTIVTSSLRVGWYAAQHQKHLLHLIGGQVEADFGIYGDLAALQHIRVDWVLLETKGLDAERGVTHNQRNYANMARALFALHAQTMLLVAPENVGQVEALFVAPASAVDVLVTGREAATPPLWDLSELGVRIVLA